MDEINLPYLYWPQGRGGVLYPTYRRDGLRRELKTPDHERLKGFREEIKKDTRVIAAWLLINEGFERDKEAEQHKASDPKHKAPWPYKKSIAHAVDDWLAECEERVAQGESAENPLAEGTLYLYRLRGREIKDIAGHRPAATMPRDAVVRMIRDRAKPNKEKPKWTPGAASSLKTALGAVFGYIADHPVTFALPDNWQNPTVSRRRRKGKTPATGWAPWEEWMIRKFRERWPVGTRERTIFETYLNTGQRGSDVAPMMRAHRHDGTIAIAQQKTKVRIWCPEANDLTPVLKKWLASHDHEPFFPSLKGKGKNPLSAHSIERILTDAIDKAGLPKTCKPHGLRYTFATRAIELTVIEKRISHQTIASIVGHRTFAMALKYTQQRRDAQLTMTTMNRGLARYRAKQEPVPV